MTRVAESKEKSKEIFSALEQIRRGGLNFSGSEANRLRNYLISQRIAPAGAPLVQFIDALKAKRITLVRDYEHVDHDRMSTRNPKFKAQFDSVLRAMERERGPADGRDIKDRTFHYKIDAWNITLSLMNDDSANYEIDYVCRSKMRHYYPKPLGPKFSRHPFVPLFKLYSLLQASPDGTLAQESSAFLTQGAHEITHCSKLIESVASRGFSYLSVRERNKIDEIYDEYIRPMFRQYSDDGGFTDVELARQEISEMNEKSFSSITSEEGFRDRFKQESDNMKSVAKNIIEIRPEVLSARLNEDYDLSGNPRITEIIRKLGLE